MIFDSCGDGCNATCGFSFPEDCQGACIEGCYCPEHIILQENKCIPMAECKCRYNGDPKDVGQEWNEAVCTVGGLVKCVPHPCSLCTAEEVPLEVEGACCPVCISDWIQESEETITITEG